MSNVIRFASPREFVVIDCGYVRGIKPPTPRHFEYWIEWVERDGASIVWSGDTYADALRAASEWQLPVVDKTGGMQ